MLEQASEKVSSVQKSKSSDKVHGGFSRLKRWQKVLISVVGGLAVIVLACVIAWNAILGSGKAQLLDTSDDEQLRSTIEYDGRLYEYNYAMTSICIIGTDRLYGDGPKDTNGEADAVMLFAYDTENGKMSLINVPRNTIVDFTISFDDGSTRDLHTFLTSAYAFGKDDAGGAAMVCDALVNLTEGIPIKNYCTLLESCIDPLTEAMGGVTLTAIQGVPWVGVKEGETYTMKGEQALRYLQWRDIRVMSSPADRMKRQQQFANAFMEQTITAVKSDPGILLEFYRIVTDPQYITTNLDFSELAYLASVAIENGVDDISLFTIPYEDVYDDGIQVSRYIPKQDELTQLILDIYYNPVE